MGLTTRLGSYLALTLLVGVILVPLGGAPAFACDCATPGLRKTVREADVVVVGRMLDREVDPGKGPVTFAGNDRAVHTIAPMVVLSGDLAGPTIEVVSAPSGASCGLEGMVRGRRYVFFAHEEQGRLTAYLCGGTARVTPVYLKEIRVVTGPGTRFGVPAPVAPHPGASGQPLLQLLTSLPWWR